MTLRVGEYYDASKFERLALQRVERSGPEYDKAEEWIIETTMSCDAGERKRWAQFYMSIALTYAGKAIADPIHKDIVLINSRAEAAAMFLAAYDIYMRY